MNPNETFGKMSCNPTGGFVNLGPPCWFPKATGLFSLSAKRLNKKPTRLYNIWEAWDLAGLVGLNDTWKAQPQINANRTLEMWKTFAPKNPMQGIQMIGHRSLGT